MMWLGANGSTAERPFFKIFIFLAGGADELEDEDEDEDDDGGEDEDEAEDEDEDEDDEEEDEEALGAVLFFLLAVLFVVVDGFWSSFSTS
jgi:hypothetical protein